MYARKTVRDTDDIRPGDVTTKRNIKGTINPNNAPITNRWQKKDNFGATVGGQIIHGHIIRPKNEEPYTILQQKYSDTDHRPVSPATRRVLYGKYV